MNDRRDSSTSIDDNESVTNNTNGKRPHSSSLSRQGQGYPRKRAMKACATCRLRKTKCNNERPTCGYCRSVGAVCDYEDESDLSFLDPASHYIVQKLEALSNRVNESIRLGQREQEGLRERLSALAAPVNHARKPSQVPSAAPVSDASARKNAENELFTPAFCTAPDNVLKWPILREHHEYNERFISDALFEQHYINCCPRLKENAPHVSSPGLGVDEGAIPRLVDQFLRNIHAETPIVDVEMIRWAAAQIAANGCGWTASSCLVLIIAALGAVSQPYNEHRPLSKEATLQAHAYYQAARKRIGVLEPDLLPVKCLFFLGTYELRLSKPVAAWKWFNMASSFLMIHLKAKTAYAKRDATFSQAPDVGRLEASLYWSCYKAMCDLRAELPLPPSQLAEIDYPPVLPPPPENFEKVMGFESGSVHGSALNDAQLQLPKSPAQLQSMENVWLYYMTDIIMSRLKNHVLKTLYDEGPVSWNPPNLFSMLSTVNEYEYKLRHWYHGLPPALKFDSSNYTRQTHLQHLTCSLALTLNLALYTPALYYMIHHLPYSPSPAYTAPPPTPSTMFALPTMSAPQVDAQIEAFAHKAVDSAIQIIQLSERSVGDWKSERRLLSAALLLVAAFEGEVYVIGRKNLYDVLRRADGLLKGIVAAEGGEEKVDLVKGREAIEGLLGDVRVG